MNRWLTRKKDGADDGAGGKKAKKGKKGQEEPKPEFNLNAALPQVDDFRTSLIMPGLSTRFSMLREQDDPSSKIGKASDDSVLQPKRQSRLHEFGFVPGGLSDIAEVSSLNGSIRPPFAEERTNSFDSTNDDGSGSMMSRARPGEGNVLFGGRQKIYMISNNCTKGLGRTLYDDDVSMSTYQRLRLEEKEKQRQAEEQNDQHSAPPSPSAHSRKRETSSSTNSASLDTRTSTAATSIASQGANSVPATSPGLPPTASVPSPDLTKSTLNKVRRLYDQGLDQHIQEQQSSAINRLNSIQRTRAPTGRSTPPISLPQARSATNLSDRFNRGPGFRSESPNQFGYSNMSRNNSSAGSSPILTRAQSPLLASPVSPVLSESDEAYALHAALQPHDRGKATALGAFNKPKEAFSEEQYAERLRQLQQEREVRPTSPPKEEASPKEEKSSPLRKPTLRERAELEKRKRAEETAERQKSERPAEQGPAATAFSRFQAAVNHMKVGGPATPVSPQKQSSPPARIAGAKARTFFTSPDSSDADEEVAKPTRRFENLPVATGPAPPIFEHPALRARSASNEKVNKTSPDTPSIVSQGLSPKPDESDVDSPTLGPDNGGLSGLIRQHLRNVSNVSSNYDSPDQPVASPPPAGLAIQTQDFQRRQPGSETVTPAPSTYSHSNPWDLDDIDNPYRDERGSISSVSPIDPSKVAPLVMSATTPNAAGAPWDLTPRRNHERVASNETEVEHEAFQRDLAQRQRLIQENLRVRAEGRSTSPAPPAASGGLKTALNMLRAKSSRESFATVDRQDGPPKGMRKLTLGAGSTNVSSTSLAGLNHDSQISKPKLSRVLQQSEQDAQREFENRQRSGTDSSRTGRPMGRPGAPNTRSSTRERSSSNTSSGRSRSRPDMYRDDLEQAMVEGSRAYPPNSGPSMPGYVAHAAHPHPTERPSMDSQSQSRMRSRSNSKTNAASYFETKHLQPIQTGVQSGTASPRLPLPQNKFSPGIPISPRPSPGGFNSPSMNGHSQPTSPMPPFSANHTPPVSNPTTPNAAAFPGVVNPMIRQGMLRKKSIAKSDISEPVFISTTSTIDLVNLPSGASLKNGAEENAPPVPPINPMRRRFGLGRGENASPSYDPAVQSGLDAPRAPYAEPARTNSSDALVGKPQQPRNRLRKTSSEGKSLRGKAQALPVTSPEMPPAGFGIRNNSPPLPINTQPILQQPMDGAMF